MLVPKVLAYITHAGRLLVFRQPHAPEQGVQVPGGGPEAGETLEAAVLREAREETGLTRLRLGAFLGSVTYQLQVDTGPPHLRHFFHVVAEGELDERWQHLEGPSSTRAEPLLRELWWEPLPTPVLNWQMDALLSALEPRRLGP